MTVTADSKRRVVLPTAKPGDLFQVRVAGEGRLVLTRMEPVEPKRPHVRLADDADGFPVLMSDRPIDEAAIKRALEEFP